MMEKQLASFRKRVGVDVSLVLFMLYIGYLLFLLLRVGSLKAVIALHFTAVLLYCIVQYGRDFLFILIAPLTAAMIFADGFRLRSFLKRSVTNRHAETVVVLAHSDWRKLDAWVNPNFFTGEIRKLAKLLRAAGKDFSFLVSATPAEVEGVMADPRVREVYFYGHGTSHMFKLGTDDILYYCDFAGGKYQKDFVHQLHCGTTHGKSLAEYVVPEANRKGCFLIRKAITANDIGKELDRMHSADALGAPKT